MDLGQEEGGPRLSNACASGLRHSPFWKSHEYDADILLDRDDDDDLEAPLVANEPGEPADATAAAAPAAAAAAAARPVIWPALRGSSVSARKLSPQIGFDHDEVHTSLRPASPHARLSGSNPLLAPAIMMQALGPSWGSPLRSGSWQLAPAATFPRNAQAAVPVAMPAPAEAAAPSAAAAHQQAGSKPADQRRATSAIVGCINAVLQLPVLISFASVIFRDSFFSPYLSSLIKLVFLASALHQAVFSLGSSMPFAVGQVQDVGLIFLSAIASSVVDECKRAGVGAADTLGTVLAVLSLSTAAVGALVVATGRLKWASLVQYCPLPVVGGYLAYVGYFCLAAGVSLASGAAVSSPQTWVNLADARALLHLLPALVMCVVLTLVLRRSRSPFALPVLLLAVPAAFYAALLLCGWSLEEARSGGWVVQPQPGDGEWRFWKLYSLYNVHSFPPTNLYWAALPAQLGKFLALYFVVAFGSSMDIAAIQADSPADLDYDSELVTVGLSNLAVGCAGVGFTGSYIFSQTVFSLRMGTDSWVMGAIIVAVELATFALPVNAISFLPNFYFGSLVMWIGADILRDWLFIVYKRVSFTEYALLVGTFAAVLALGLEAGIAAGVVAAALQFTYQYAQVSVQAFTVVPSRSGSVRSFDQRTVLEAFAGRVAAVSLSGMIFFGSAQRVADQVLEVASAVLQTQPHINGELPVSSISASAAAVERDGPRPLHAVPSARTLSATYDQFSVLMDSSGLLETASALQEAPLVLLLDLSRVQGIDATAARTFVTLHAKLARRGVRLTLTGLRHGDAVGRRLRRVLIGQGLILQDPTEPSALPSLAAQPEGSCAWFSTMDAGARWCEEQFLEVAVRRGLCRPRAERVTLAEVLRSNLELPRLILGPGAVDYGAVARRLEQFCSRQAMAAGEVLFEVEGGADEIYFLESGAVVCEIDFLAATVHSRSVVAAVPARVAAHRPARVLRFGPGGILGDLDFMLQRPRSFTAVCERGGSVWVLPRPSFERLASAAPEVLILLQTVMLRLNCLSATHALEAQERSAL